MDKTPNNKQEQERDLHIIRRVTEQMKKVAQKRIKQYM